MNTYLISYDLMRPGQNYTTLHTHIKSYGNWAKPLESFWLIKSSATAVQIKNAIRAHVDANDKVIVINVTGREAAWVNLPDDVSTWIKSTL